MGGTGSGVLIVLIEGHSVKKGLLSSGPNIGGASSLVINFIGHE